MNAIEIDALKKQGFTWTQIANASDLTKQAVRGRWRRWKKRNSHIVSSGGKDTSLEWREFFDSANEMKKKIDAANMWVDNANVLIQTDSPVTIVVTSDWHIGEKSCDMEALKRDVDKWLNTDDLFVIINGDLIENGTGSIGTQSATEQIISPEMQHRVAAQIVKELSDNDKLITITSGNHEQRSERVLFETFRQIVGDTNAAIFGNKGVVSLEIISNNSPPSVIYDIFVGHKMPGMTANNPFGAHMRMLKTYDIVDISLIGHVHNWNYAVVPIHGKEVHCATTGAYVDAEYGKRFYGKTLPYRNHYFVLDNKKKHISHFIA